MPNFQKLCVFDLETDGPDPETCSPIQIAAVIVDPIKLEIVKNSDFNCSLKPELLEKKPDHAYEDSDILDFHAKVRGTSKEQVLASWREFQSQEQGWKMFVSYLDMYHTRSDRKSLFSAPIACGYNINRFDLKIVERLSKKYRNVDKEGKSNLFYPRDIVDVMNYMFIWFENSDELKNYKLDNIRDYLGIDKEGAHDALKDVYDTANILIRFMKLHRNLSHKVKFKNSFAKN